MNLTGLKAWIELGDAYELHVSREVTDWLRDQITALVIEIERFRTRCPHDENEIGYDVPVEFTCVMCGGLVAGVRRPCVNYDTDWWDDGLTVDGVKVDR